MRVDYDQRILSCSVNELIQDAPPSRFGLERGDGFRRMWLGQRVHVERADIRAAEDPNYRAEVAVSHEAEVDGWTIRVSGRIDGLSVDHERGVAVIEEVKSIL